jgi:hypothetical protein
MVDSGRVLQIKWNVAPVCGTYVVRLIERRRKLEIRPAPEVQPAVDLSDAVYTASQMLVM